MALRYAYNTNGTTHHRLDEAVAMIADAGYDGVALTIDQHYLDPMRDGWERRTEVLAADLARRKLGCVIETGAKFVLDPRRKHSPTLVSADADARGHRGAFLGRALAIGAMLGAEAMSFWSGSPDEGTTRDDAMGWLRDGVSRVLDQAERVGIVAAMEPEPEMMIGTVDGYAAVAAACPRLRLALDLGHVMVTGEREPEAAVLEFGPRIGTVSLEDMKRGRHLHLPFGEGDMDIPACLDALERVGFGNLVCVELSADSGRAEFMVPEARRWLETCRTARAAA